METLEQKIEALIAEFGAEAFVKVVKAHSVPSTDVTTPTCSKGYYWNGTACVLDIGE
jgi:hypothetical protein